MSLAWKRVAQEVAEGTLGGEFDRNDRAELQSRVKIREEAAQGRGLGRSIALRLLRTRMRRATASR